MPVTLSKIIEGKPTVDDTSNGLTVLCPQCARAYWLGYTDSEWHRLKDWLKLAETALRKDHAARHEVARTPLEWRAIRRAEGECGAYLFAYSPHPRVVNARHIERAFEKCFYFGLGLGTALALIWYLIAELTEAL